jgi:hypothetical protein
LPLTSMPRDSFVNPTTTATSLHNHDHLILRHHKSTPRNHPIKIIKMRSKFKDEHPFEKRKAEAERIVSYLLLQPPPNHN